MIEPLVEGSVSSTELELFERQRSSESIKRSTARSRSSPGIQRSESLVRLFPRIVETLSESFWDFDILVVDEVAATTPSKSLESSNFISRAAGMSSA